MISNVKNEFAPLRLRERICSQRRKGANFLIEFIVTPSVVEESIDDDKARSLKS